MNIQLYNYTTNWVKVTVTVPVCPVSVSAKSSQRNCENELGRVLEYEYEYYE